MYDVIVIGGGPAGVAAGVYSARKQMKTLFLADAIGGQSTVSAEIENWIGTAHMKGYELAQMLERHLKAQKDIDVHVPEKAESIKKIDGGYRIVTNAKKEYETQSIILATGGKHRHLNVPGEEKFTRR